MKASGVPSVCLAILAIAAPAAVAADWVVVAEDTAIQVSVDADSVATPQWGIAQFKQRLRSKPKAQPLTPQGVTRIDSVIQANCHLRSYKVLSYSAYDRRGKLIERNNIPAQQQIAIPSTPNYLAMEKVCQ